MGRLFVILLIIIFECLYASVSEESVKSYDALYDMQKDPNRLVDALNCTLSTLMYAEENFPSQLSAEQLLERIYTKIQLLEQFNLDDPVFSSILKESTKDILNALEKTDKKTDHYVQTYPLLDFLVEDFFQAIEQYHFEKFKEYLELNKLADFEIIETLDGKQVQKLTTHLIETIVQKNYSLSNEIYTAIVEFGKDKLLNYLSIQINPYLNKTQADTYEKQFYLLKAYLAFYKSRYGDTFQEQIPKEKFDYYLELKDYFDYLSNVEILSRRLLTAEKETLGNLFPVFINYIELYNQIKLKTIKLNNSVHSMIKNASTRFSYENIDLKVENIDFSRIEVSNEEINESLKNLLTLLKPKEKEIKPEKQSKFIRFIKKPVFIIPTIVIIGVLMLLLLLLPLKFRGTLLKNFGLNNRALSLFEKAAIKNPMDADIHIKTAQIYERLGREEEAMNEYKIASKVLDMKED